MDISVKLKFQLTNIKLLILKYFLDCTGCTYGGYNCSPYCYSYSCGGRNCGFESQNSFCGTYGGQGCDVNDGCFAESGCISHQEESEIAADESATQEQ